MRFIRCLLVGSTVQLLDNTFTKKVIMVLLCLFYRLYTLGGKPVESGLDLENGQCYVAVGRDKFKKLPYNELLFSKSTVKRSYGYVNVFLPSLYWWTKILVLVLDINMVNYHSVNNSESLTTKRYHQSGHNSDSADSRFPWIYEGAAGYSGW